MKTRSQTVPPKADDLLRHALEVGDLRLERAVRRWKRLRRKDQHRIVRELVEARSDELRRAYPAIHGVAYGLRTLTIDDARCVTREPCVVFLVYRKWKQRPRTRAALGRELPAYIWAHGTDPRSGLRGLCAVPVDVESGTDYWVRPHAGNHVLVHKNAIPMQKGVVTCAVSMPPGFGGAHAISCHHVFAMSKVTSPPGSPANNAHVSVGLPGNQPGTRIGRLSPFRGRLVPGSQGASFDAALARVDDPQALAQVLQPPTPVGAIASEDEMPFSFWIMTPRRPIKAVWVQNWVGFDNIVYFSGSNRPVQPLVIEAEVRDSIVPQGGDSGSPVLDSAKRKLIGMHIAGKRSRAFFLAAHHLLDGQHYGLNGPLKLLT